MKYILVLTAIFICLSRPVFADEAKDFVAANDKMMENMHMTPTGDADRDFAAMMIPHHQGAVDMAKVELQYGKNPEMRALAQKIMDAQKPEIDQMEKWLSEHPAK